MSSQSRSNRFSLERHSLRRSGGILAVIVLSTLVADQLEAADHPAPLPEFKVVETAVRKQLASRRGYLPADILSQKDVSPVFAPIEKLGWKVTDKKQILASVLGDGDFLVQQLRTGNGVAFMRKLSKTKDAYARLDQLRKLKYGNRRIRELIQSPGGHTLILYMTNTQGGKNLNRQLRRTANGKNFGKPTKRIYSADDLLARLSASYKAEQKRRQLPVKRSKPGTPRKTK